MAARSGAALARTLLARRALQQTLAGPSRRGLAAAAASLGETEVAISMLAAPVTKADLASAGSKGTEGVGVVTAVGSKVKGVSVGEWVIPTSGTVGTFTSSAKAKEADVAAVPSDIPVEYAANVPSAVTALKLLEGLKAGDVVVQADAESTVGLAVVQMAKARGVATVNILKDGPGYFDRAGLVKELGGDVVVTDKYAASSPNFAQIMAALGKPKAAFSEGTALPPSAGVGKMLSYGPGGQVSGAAWLAKASAAERAKAIGEVVGMFRSGALHVWVERHPFSDMAAAVAEAKEPFKARRVLLVINEPAAASAVGDLGKLQSDFEAAFTELKAKLA